MQTGPSATRLVRPSTSCTDSAVCSAAAFSLWELTGLIGPEFDPMPSQWSGLAGAVFASAQTSHERRIKDRSTHTVFSKGLPMELHRRNDTRAPHAADICGRQAVELLQSQGRTVHRRRSFVHQRRTARRPADCNARQNRPAFCQTRLDAELHQLMASATEENMTRNDRHPATAELERRWVLVPGDTQR